MGVRARLGYIAAADAALLVIGLIGLVAVGPPAGKARTVTAGGDVAATTTVAPTTPPSTAAITTVAAAPVAKPKGRAVTATTAKTASAAPAATAAQPPKDGTYRFASHVDNPDAPAEMRSTSFGYSQTFRTVKRSAAEVEQSVESKADKPSGSSGNLQSSTSSSSTLSMFWRADGVYLRASGGDPGAGSCTPAEHLIMRLPLAAGATWTTTTDCTFNAGGSSGTSHSDITNTVAGQKVVPFLGRQIPVWEIATRSKGTGTFAFNGADHATQSAGTGTQLYAPTIGLTLHSEGTNKSTASDGKTSTTSYTQDLQNLDPA